MNEQTLDEYLEKLDRKRLDIDREQEIVQFLPVLPFCVAVHSRREATVSYHVNDFSAASALLEEFSEFLLPNRIENVSVYRRSGAVEVLPDARYDLRTPKQHEKLGEPTSTVLSCVEVQQAIGGGYDTMTVKFWIDTLLISINVKNSWRYRSTTVHHEGSAYKRAFDEFLEAKPPVDFDARIRWGTVTSSSFSISHYYHSDAFIENVRRSVEVPADAHV